MTNMKENEQALQFNALRSWILAIAVTLGVCMLGFILFSLTNCLATIHQDLNLDLAQLQWLITGYGIFVAMVICFSGQLADRFGRINTFIVATIFQLAGSILAAISTNLWLLLIGRMLQGVGGGIIVPISLAIIKISFPQHKIKAPMYIWGLSTLTAYLLGSIFGGLLATYVNWRMIFWVTLPIPAFVLIVLFSNYNIENYVPRSSHIDIIGTSLLGAFLILFTLLFSEAQIWGWSSAAIITLICVTPVLFILFIICQFYVKEPILLRELLMYRKLVLGAIIVGINMAIIVGVFYFFCYTVQSNIARGYSEFISGISLIPLLAPSIFFFFISGWCIKKLGHYKLILLGYALQLAGCLALAFTYYDTLYINIWWRLVLTGLGSSIFWIISPNYCLHNIPLKHSGKAAALFEIGRYSGAVIGINLAQIWYVHNMQSFTQKFWKNLKLSNHAPNMIELFHANHNHAYHFLQQHAQQSLHIKQLLAQAVQAGFRGSMWIFVIMAALGLGLATLLPIKD